MMHQTLKALSRCRRLTVGLQQPMQRALWSLLVACLLMKMGPSNGENLSSTESGAGALRVKSVHPKASIDLPIAVEQPATIAPYYRAALYTETAGKVIFLEKDIGHSVVEGEKIAVIKPDDKAAAPEIIDSPFDGVIASRSVDPGTFVPSAAVVPGAAALVTVERTDIVTISSQMPDRVAALINRETAAEIFFDNLPGGGPLRAHITRLAPSLSPADRTLRVEIDLWNRDEASFREFITRSNLKQYEDLKGREPPQFPTGLAPGEAARLIPGSYGRLRLLIRHNANTLLLPNAAIRRANGLAFVYRLQNGVVQRIQVDVEIEDGKSAHVVIRDPRGAPSAHHEVLISDEFLASNLGELEDGQPVRAILSDW